MTTGRSNRANWILFCLLACIWGSSYFFFKIAGESVPPITVVAFRMLTGTAVLAGVTLATRPKLPLDGPTLFKLFILGVINIAIPQTLISWGEHYIDSSLAGILQATTPLFTIVLSAALLSDEAATIGRIAGLTVGFLGAIVLVGRAASGAAPQGELLGELAVTASSFAYAAGNVYARRTLRHVQPLPRALFQLLFGFILTGIAAVVVEQPFTLPTRPEAIFAILEMGVFGSAVGYLIYFRLLDTWGPTRSSLVTYLQPLVALALGMAFLSETLDIRVAVGTAMILSGVWLVNSRYGQRRIGPSRVSPAPAPAPVVREPERESGEAG